MSKKIISTQKISKRFITIVAALLLVVSTVSSALLGTMTPAVAASTSIYFSPSVKTVQKGKTFTVQVRISPGVAVNTAAFTANFTSSKISLVSKSLSGGVMSTAIVNSSTSSSVSFEGTKLGGQVLGDSLIETLTFKAVGGSGTTTITLSDARANAASDSSELSVVRGSATITLTTPTTPKPPAKDPPKKDTTKKPTKTDTKKDTTKKDDTKKSTTTSAAPKLVSQKSAVEFTKAKVVLTSDVATTAYLLYGTSSPTQKSAVSASAKSHTITLTGSNILPGTTYKYVIVLTNSKGVVAKSAQMTLTTKGLPIHIQVLDGTGSPLASKSVTIHSDPQTVTTDKDGYADFAVAPGTHTLQYTENGKTYSSKLVVANNTKTVSGAQQAATQDFSVVLPVVHSNQYQLYVLIALVVVAVLLVILILRKNNRFAFTPSKGSWGSEAPPQDTPSQMSAPTTAPQSGPQWFVGNEVVGTQGQSTQESPQSVAEQPQESAPVDAQQSEESSVDAVESESNDTNSPDDTNPPQSGPSYDNH